MPTKLSHLFYRLVGRSPPDHWIDRSMMQQQPTQRLQQQQQQQMSSWTQSFLFSAAPAATTTNTASTATTTTPRGGSGGASKTALPAKIKVRAENERQLEVKIVYNLGGVATAALYKVDIFFFMPAELEPRDSTGWFYLSLYSVVRLHTPRVPLSSLSSRGASEGCLLAPIASALDAVDAAARAVERARDELRGELFAGGAGGESSSGGESDGEYDDDDNGKRRKQRRRNRRRKCSLLPPTPLACVRRRRLARCERELEQRATDAAELMRMHACIFRTAMRAAAATASEALKKAAAVVVARREAGTAGSCASAAAAAAAAAAADAAAAAGAPASTLDENKSCPVVDGAARVTLRMVEAACESLEALSETCERCEEGEEENGGEQLSDYGGRGWPKWLREAWRLVDEFCLLEAERSLLKLLVDIEPVALGENTSVAGGSSEDEVEDDDGGARRGGTRGSRSSSPRDRLALPLPPTALGTRSMPPLPVLRQQQQEEDEASAASSASLSPASPAALQLMKQRRGSALAAPSNNTNNANAFSNSGSTSGAIDLSRLLRSPTVPGMGHTLSRSYSLRGLDDESQVALQDILMASQRGPSAQQSQQQNQQQLPPHHRRRMRLRSSSQPPTPPPPPPPQPSIPRVPAAGWSGRYPHLDAVRVSALAHRQSIDVPSSYSSTAAAAAAAVAEAGGGGESFLFGGNASLLVPPGSASSPKSPPALQAQHPGLSAAEAASREAWKTNPPPSSFASASVASSLLSPPSTAPATAVTSLHPSTLLSPIRVYPPDDPRGARSILREAVAGLEATRARRGFQDSLLRDGPPQANERYTARLQALKKHARAAISLTPRTRQPSNVLADLVGMFVAAVAMAFATGTVFLAQKQGPQFGALYIMILVGGYVVKDRLKEWGKRYLAPLAAFLSVPLYDRRVEVVDGRGVVVGRVSELVRACDPKSLHPRVLSLRHEGSSLGAHARAAAQPERVLAYSKRVDVKWGSVGARLRGVVALSDVMRFDLTPLRRRMQPAIEAHARLSRGGGQGASPCEAVACARVYHVNVVLRVRAAAPTAAGPSSIPPPTPGKERDGGGRERSRTSTAAAAAATAGGSAMVLERARVVMDQNGIVRLEPAGRSRLAVKRPARGLAAWGAGIAGGNGGAPPVVVTAAPAPPSTEGDAPSAGDSSSGRFKGALGNLWKNSAGKLVSRRRGARDAGGEGGERETAGDAEEGGDVIFVGDRIEGGEEGEGDGDVPVGDEAV